MTCSPFRWYRQSNRVLNGHRWTISYTIWKPKSECIHFVLIIFTVQPKILQTITCIYFRKEILNRIVELQRNSGSNDMAVERPLQSPPSYQEATSCSGDDQSNISEPDGQVSFSQLSEMLRDLRVDIDQSSEAIVLISCERAQVFFISANGQVTSPSMGSNLKIFMLEGIHLYIIKIIWYITPLRFRLLYFVRYRVGQRIAVLPLHRRHLLSPHCQRLTVSSYGIWSIFISRHWE